MLACLVPWEWCFQILFVLWLVLTDCTNNIPLKSDAPGFLFWGACCGNGLHCLAQQSHDTAHPRSAYNIKNLRTSTHHCIWRSILQRTASQSSEIRKLCFYTVGVIVNADFHAVIGIFMLGVFLSQRIPTISHHNKKKDQFLACVWLGF